MKTYVCIDTNIYIRFMTQGMPGCEEEHWDSLISFLDAGDITLLLPEVVQLELQKKWLEIPQIIEAKLLAARKSLEKDLRDKVDYSEIRDILPSLLDEFNKLESKKQQSMLKRYDKVQKLLRPDNVVTLPFDLEIMLAAKKRSIRGGLAIPGQKSEADCILIETLVTFFEEERVDCQLLFCSENKKDFALEVDDGELTLHPNVKKGLPSNEFFLDLRSLVEFVMNDEKIPSHTEKEVAQALERSKAESIQDMANVYIDALHRVNEQSLAYEEAIRRNQRQVEEYEEAMRKAAMLSGLPDEAVRRAEAHSRWINAIVGNLLSNVSDSVSKQVDKEIEEIGRQTNSELNRDHEEE